jgi:hypothetical protein
VETEWRLTFEAYRETTVLRTADDPSIEALCVFVDQVLDTPKRTNSGLARFRI